MMTRTPRTGWARGAVAALLLLASLTLQAQNTGDAGAFASIRGTIRDSHSGEPIEGVIVSVDTSKTTYMNSAMVLAPGADPGGFTTSDEHGRYYLPKVPAGRRTLRAFNRKGIFNFAGRFVEVRGGDTLKDFDIRMSDPGTISGRVLDDKGEPLPAAVVYLVAHEYFLGEARYYLRFMATTDDAGNYSIETVPAGQKFRLWVTVPPPNYNALAAARTPLDPKRRRPAYAPVFYPDVPNPEAGTVITLHSGERREGMDFVILRAPSLCAEGRFIAPPDVGRIQFWVAPAQPSYGTTGRMGFYGRSPGGTLEAGRPFRMCGLAPGEYRLTVYNETTGGRPISHWAVTTFTLVDRDVQGLDVALGTPLKIPYRFEWAAEPPKDYASEPIPVSLQPVYRSSFMGEDRNGRAEIPGDGEFGVVLPDLYYASARFVSSAARFVDYSSARAPDGFYVKEIRYGDRSVLHAPLPIGGGTGDEIRIVVAHDAGTLTARVTDTEGKPVGDCYIHLIPMDAGDEGSLADRMFSGQTDQTGQHTWNRTIPPGTYRAVATHDPAEYTPEWIHALWQARRQAPEIQVAPNGSAELAVVLPAEP